MDDANGQATYIDISLAQYACISIDQFLPPEQERLSVVDGSGCLWAEHLRAGRPTIPQDHLPLGRDPKRRVPRQKGTALHTDDPLPEFYY